MQDACERALVSRFLFCLASNICTYTCQEDDRDKTAELRGKANRTELRRGKCIREASYLHYSKAEIMGSMRSLLFPLEFNLINIYFIFSLKLNNYFLTYYILEYKSKLLRIKSKISIKNLLMSFVLKNFSFCLYRRYMFGRTLVS